MRADKPVGHSGKLNEAGAVNLFAKLEARPVTIAPSAHWLSAPAAAAANKLASSLIWCARMVCTFARAWLAKLYLGKWC